MYVELDHNLVPRKRKDIHSIKELPGREIIKDTWVGHYKLHKYELKQENTQNILLEFEKRKLDLKATNKLDATRCEPVIGPSEKIFYDEDFGFFSAILACYNNHWILKTSPDDWWNVITGTIARAIDDNGNKEKVRNLFIEHEGHKAITIEIPELDMVDYSWLFDQFSQGIRANIKTPGYVDLMQADFSTTNPNQLISSQVMIMSSMQRYFSFGFGTSCGIPGVEMQGTQEDWEQLLNKTVELEKLLESVLEDIMLTEWFLTTKNILRKLLDTFNENPDIVWWSHVLSWNTPYGSGDFSHLIFRTHSYFNFSR